MVWRLLQIKADSVNNYLAKSKKNAHDEKANDDFDMLVTKTTFDYIMLADLKSPQTTVQLRSTLNLSLIHISEPTRPY